MLTKTEMPTPLIDEYEIDRCAHVDKVPKIVRDTFRAVFSSVRYGDDCLAMVEVSDESLSEWSRVLGVRPSAVRKRIARMVDEGFMCPDHDAQKESYVISPWLYGFQGSYGNRGNEGFLVVSEQRSDEWDGVWFPKFINALSWHERFSDQTRRVFSYAMAHVSETEFGCFVNASMSFVRDASAACHVSADEVIRALEDVKYFELFHMTRSGVYCVNTESLFGDTPPSSVAHIDAKFRYDRLGWNMSYRYVDNGE
jgi:hypothetical protein